MLIIYNNFCFLSEENKDQKLPKKRLVKLEENEFLFDEAIIDALYGDDISNEDLIKLLYSMGFSVRKEENETEIIFYLKQVLFFIDRDDKKGLIIDNKNISKTFGLFNCSLLNECGNNLFGNTTDNGDTIINYYKVFSRKSNVFHSFISSTYKKQLFCLNQETKYIKDISLDIFDDNEFIDKTLIIKNHPLIKYNAINKMLEYLFDVPNKLTPMNNMDFTKINNSFINQGYISNHIYGNSLIYTLDNQFVSLVYHLNHGIKYKFNETNIIMEGNQSIKQSIKNLMDFIYKTSQYFSTDVKYINEILISKGLKCSEVFTEIIPNNKFNINIVLSPGNADENKLTDIIFRNVPIKQKTLFRFATNSGFYIGEKMPDEFLIRLLINTLTTFLGEQPIIDVNKDGILTISFSKSPNGLKWCSDNLQKSFNLNWSQSQGLLLTFSPFKYQQFAVLQSLLHYNCSPNIVWTPTLSKNIFKYLGISLNGEIEFINYNNFKFGINAKIPIYFSDLKDFISDKFSNVNNKSHSSNLLNEIMSLLQPKISLYMEKNSGLFSNKLSINFSTLNEKYSLLSFFLFKNTKALEQIPDYQTIMEKKLSTDKYKLDFSWDFSLNLTHQKNNLSGFYINSNLFTGYNSLNSSMFWNIKIIPSYHKLFQISNEKLIFSLLSGFGIGKTTSDGLINANNDNCNLILIPSEIKSFKQIIGFRFFFVKEIVDSKGLMGLPLGGLSHGFFINGAIFRGISISHDSEEVFFKQYFSDINNLYNFSDFKFGYFISVGYIIMIEFQTMCFYFAFGFSNKGFTIDFGIIPNYNVKMIDNLMHFSNN